MQKHYNYNDAHDATIREIDKQNSSRAYSGWKSRIISHARQYKTTIDDKHFSHDCWSQQKCMTFLKEKLGTRCELVKILEKNSGYL